MHVVPRLLATHLPPTQHPLPRYMQSPAHHPQDKLGPMTRHAIDTAIVMDAIRGKVRKPRGTRCTRMRMRALAAAAGRGVMSARLRRRHTAAWPRSR